MGGLTGQNFPGGLTGPSVSSGPNVPSGPNWPTGSSGMGGLFGTPTATSSSHAPNQFGELVEEDPYLIPPSHPNRFAPKAATLATQVTLNSFSFCLLFLTVVSASLSLHSRSFLGNLSTSVSSR